MAAQTPGNNALLDNTKVLIGTDFGILIRGLDDTLDMIEVQSGSPFWNGTAWTFVTSLPASGDVGGDLTGTLPNPSINANAVSFAKMQDIPTSTLIGRSTAGNGDPESLTAAQVRSLLALGTAALANTGTTSGTIPLVGAGDVLPASVIPPLRSHEFASVLDTAARLALTSAQVQPGDEAYETSTGDTYKLVGTDPSISANWSKVSDVLLDASAITSGVISPARLGSGTADGTTVLFGDQQYRPLPPSRLPVSVVTTGTSMAVETAYYANAASQISLLLPAVSAVGDRINIRGINSGGWRITQNTGQQVRYLDLITIAGATGWIETLTSPDSSRASVELECIVANTLWQVVAGVGVVDVKVS